MAEKKDEKPEVEYIDPTDHDAVAAYIDAHGIEAFQVERRRQSGYVEGDQAI